MLRQRLLSVILVMTGAVMTSAQASPSASPADALELLAHVAKHYTNATSFYLVATQERSSAGQLQHSWQKDVLTASEAPGHRFFYEALSGYGHSLKASDGKTVWTYRVNKHR